jgi:hypothetical protein
MTLLTVAGTAAFIPVFALAISAILQSWGKRPVFAAGMLLVTASLLSVLIPLWVAHFREKPDPGAATQAYLDSQLRALHLRESTARFTPIGLLGILAGFEVCFFSYLNSRGPIWFIGASAASIGYTLVVLALTRRARAKRQSEIESLMRNLSALREHGGET